MSSWQQLCR